MKRIMMVLLTGAIVASGATWALAAHDEAVPAECADAHGGTDIVDGTIARYTPGLLTVDLKLGGASCLAADYSVVVLDDDPSGGTPVVLDAISFPGDGTSSDFKITRPIADEDGLLANQRICVNIAVSTTQHVETGSVTSGSTQPGNGNGDPSSMEDTSTDTNSVDTETVVDWGSEDSEEGAVPCVVLDLDPNGSGSRGFN